MKPFFAKRRIILITSVLLLSILLSGCLPDTCNPGDNMTNPRLVKTFDSSVTFPELVITWDVGTERGADLPSSYFAALELSCINFREGCSRSLIEDVSYQENTQSITVRFKDLNSHLSTDNEISFALQFPDREDYIDCEHPGKRDRYFLNVNLSFLDGNFVDVEFTEILKAGAI